MITFQFNDLTVEVFDDPTYSYASRDNKHDYLKQYFSEGGKGYPVSKHGVKVFNNGEKVNSCIVIGSGGATGVYNHSALVDNNRLLICCCDTLFCLVLPELTLAWQTKADDATCFQVFKLFNDYLVYGELTISRIDKRGILKWQFGGADIFVSIDGDDAFQLNSDHILLTDFCKTRYKIDFDGKLL